MQESSGRLPVVDTVIEEPAMDASPALTPAAPARGTRPSRAVLATIAAIVLLVLVALVLAVAAPTTPSTYAPGTPEAAFQGFYAAWGSGDLETAYGYLSSDVTHEMTLSDYRQADAEQSWLHDQQRRLVLQGVDITGERAVLHVRVDEFNPGGLGGNRYSYDRAVRLAREGGDWRIDEPLVGIESVAYKY